MHLDGKNLLLFGENGSGKSSIAVALREFFNRASDAKPFEDFRHVFTRDSAGQPLTTGHVSVQFDDDSVHQWPIGATRPTRGVVAEAALRFVTLNYRSLSEVHARQISGRPDLYRLLIEDVLRDLPVVVTGRRPTKLGVLVEEARRARPSYHNQRNIKAVKDACARLTEALANHLPQIAAEANRLLAQFGDLGMTFQLQPPTVDYDERWGMRSFTGRKLELTVQIYSHGPEEPQHFLNEARLSALALAIYFAAARIALPPGVPGAPPPTRTMLLDDVLIGLDHSNRLPVLQMLQQEFADWQILLLTHDRVWFDLAHEYTEHTGQWTYLRLLEMQTAPGQPTRPLIEPHGALVDVAEKHLNAGDLMAAAVYIRSAFEVRLRNVCRGYGVEIAYKPDPKEVKSDKLWEGIVKRQQTRQANGQADFIAPQLMQDVETVRSTVLNQLSHFGAPNLATKDVRFALDTIRELTHHQFTKVP